MLDQIHPINAGQAYRAVEKAAKALDHSVNSFCGASRVCFSTVYKWRSNPKRPYTLKVWNDLIRGERRLRNRAAN